MFKSPKTSRAPKLFFFFFKEKRKRKAGDKTKKLSLRSINPSFSRH